MLSPLLLGLDRDSRPPRWEDSQPLSEILLDESGTDVHVELDQRSVANVLEAMG